MAVDVDRYFGYEFDEKRIMAFTAFIVEYIMLSLSYLDRSHDSITEVVTVTVVYCGGPHFFGLILLVR